MPRDTDYLEHRGRVAIQEELRIESLKGIAPDLEAAIGDLARATSSLFKFRHSDSPHMALDERIDRDLSRAFDHLENAKAYLSRRIKGEQ